MKLFLLSLLFQWAEACVALLIVCVVQQSQSAPPRILHSRAVQHDMPSKPFVAVAPANVCPKCGAPAGEWCPTGFPFSQCVERAEAQGL